MKLVWHWPEVLEDGDHCTLELLDNDGFQIDTVDLRDYPGAWDTEDPYSMAESDLMARNGIRGDVPVIAPW